MDLGANEWTTFWKITFPLILPGVVAPRCWRSASRSTTTSSPASPRGRPRPSRSTSTAPQLRGIPVQVNVIGTMIFVSAVALVILTTIWQRRVAARDFAPAPASRERGRAGKEPRHDDIASHRARRAADAPLPDRSVVPAGLGPDHEPRHRPRRGLVADHDRRRALSRLLLRDRGHEHRPRPSAGRRGGPGAGGEAPPRPAEHHVPRAGAPALRAARHVLPGDGWGAFLSNSGAEAVEASVKLARIATGRPVILGFRYGYHGRTGQTMALTTAKDVYRGHFEPLPGSVYHTAYPYCYRAPGGAHVPTRAAPATGRPSST